MAEIKNLPVDHFPLGQFPKQIFKSAFGSLSLFTNIHSNPLSDAKSFVEI